MTNQQRIHLIERYLRIHKYADLQSLARHFGGSLSTVRRALDTLEDRGIARRHHGGASLVETDALEKENDFLVRIQRQADRKFAIASIVAEQVAPGSTVILDGGTTTFAVARLLLNKSVQVITNSLPVAGLFGVVGRGNTIVTGGSILGRLGVLVGPLCEASFEETHADIAILGGSGITESGVWNVNALIIATQRKMLAAADRAIFALDASKFGRKALSLTAPFGPNITVVTDTPPAPGVAAAIATAGARLKLAGSTPPVKSLSS